MRVVDIDEASLKAVGQWPWPRTVLADLVDKLVAGGAAAIGFDIVFPEPDRMSPANALRFCRNRRRSRLCARRSTSSVKRPGLCRGDRKGAGYARFHRRAPRHLAPRDEGRLRSWRRRPAVRTYYPGAASSLKELQDKAQGSGSLNWIPEHDQIIRRMPMVIRVDDALFAGDMLRLAQGPRPTW